jgi:multiple sugar transport system permease protein
MAQAVPSQTPLTTAQPARKAQTLRGLRRREALTAYLFILPTLVGFLVFTLGPMLFSAGLSLFDWDVMTEARFVGLDNFLFLLSDNRFLVGFRNTVTFVVLVVGLNTLVSLALAAALQTKMPGVLRYLFRTAFFIPVVTSTASIAIILGFLFHKELGVVNYYLNQIGIPQVPWLTSTAWAMRAVVLATVWKTFGFDLILAVGQVADRVVPVNGRAVIRPMCTLTLSADHRMLDGALAAKFLSRVKTALEQPFELLR